MPLAGDQSPVFGDILVAAVGDLAAEQRAHDTLNMLQGEARHQQGDGVLADRLDRAPAEDPLGRRVPLHDLALVVGLDHRKGIGLEDLLKAMQGRAQLAHHLACFNMLGAHGSPLEK